MAEINLAQEIAQHLRQYSSDVERDLESAKKQVGQKAVKELRNAGSFDNRTGRYRKGWRLQKNGNNYVIFNATDASLTHCLNLVTPCETVDDLKNLRTLNQLNKWLSMSLKRLLGRNCHEIK